MLWMRIFISPWSWWKWNYLKWNWKLSQQSFCWWQRYHHDRGSYQISENLQNWGKITNFFKAGQNDVCYTQIREELTNGTDLITLTRGIYRNQYASTASYPQYSNQTDESFTCSTNLCNDDSSTFRNRNANRDDAAGNPESFNEQFTGECYLCTDSPTSPNEACRNPTPELVASGTVQRSSLIFKL